MTKLDPLDEIQRKKDLDIEQQLERNGIYGIDVEIHYLLCNHTPILQLREYILTKIINSDPPTTNSWIDINKNDSQHANVVIRMRKIEGKSKVSYFEDKM